jgi:hypothetical protein
VLLNLLEIDGRTPRISINDSNEDIIEVDAVGFEEHFLQVLGTPRYIRRFTLLLELSDVMLSVAHEPKLAVVAFDESFGLDV